MASAFEHDIHLGSRALHLKFQGHIGKKCLASEQGHAREQNLETSAMGIKVGRIDAHLTCTSTMPKPTQT